MDKIDRSETFNVLWILYYLQMLNVGVTMIVLSDNLGNRPYTRLTSGRCNK